MSENEITEKELKERAVAPRVTLEALENNIKKETFLTYEGGTLTICVLELQNGFTVTGQSACADPANYQKDIGERIARENAKKEIWALMGYALRDELYKLGEGSTFLDRMKKERQDLQDKINKLNAFINGNEQFKKLNSVEQSLLKDQEEAMNGYEWILGERIRRAES